ncbi:MAG: integrase core domain-containing protein [Mangrovibacterium sp.]
MDCFSTTLTPKLQDNGVQNGDPRENAIAERINGIIKKEYLCAQKVEILKKAKYVLIKIIALFNNERPHMSISNLTLSYVHDSTEPLEIRKLWKNNWQKETTFVNQCQE